VQNHIYMTITCLQVLLYYSPGQVYNRVAEEIMQHH